MRKSDTRKALRSLRMLRTKGALGRESCPAEFVNRMTSEKWKLLIIRELLSGSVRFADLRRNLPHISSKVLSEQLNDLIEQSLIDREVVKTNAAGVRYSLTGKGQSLAPVVLEMHKWGKHYQMD